MRRMRGGHAAGAAASDMIGDPHVNRLSDVLRQKQTLRAFASLRAASRITQVESDHRAYMSRAASRRLSPAHPLGDLNFTAKLRL